MTTHEKEHNHTPHHSHEEQEANISGVVGSMIGLVTAGTQFSVEQMQNAASMFTDPKGAMGRVKESIDNLSDAMKGKTHSASTRVHVDEPVHGRKA